MSQSIINMPYTLAVYRHDLAIYLNAYRIAKARLRTKRYNMGKCLAECKAAKRNLKRTTEILHSLMFLSGATSVKPQHWDLAA